MDEIEVILESNEEETEFQLVFKKLTRITMSELILELECYLSDLTRAETELRASAFVH